MPSGDDLGGLLRTFFRRQLPQPWPPPRVIPISVAPSRRPTSGRSLMRSRWALAASVALLFLTSLLLSSRFTQDARPDHGPNGPIISDIPRDMHKKHKNPQPIDKKIKLGFADEDDEHHPLFRESELLSIK
jgi:hypothetical protein